MTGPLYRQIADQLRRLIESGELKAGMQIPTEDQLMGQFHTSRNTVRGALRELTTRGLVYTLHGKGTFVSERPAPIVITLTSDPETGRGGGEGLVYTAEVAASGRKPELRDLVVGFRRARPAIARSLEIPEEAEVIFRQEGGYVDGLRWSRQTSYYPGVWRFLPRGCSVPATSAKEPSPTSRRSASVKRDTRTRSSGELQTRKKRLISTCLQTGMFR